MQTVDVRCPVNPKQLFMRINRDPRVRIVPGNLIEVSCRHCRNMKIGGRDVAHVLHRFNILGEHVEDEIVMTGGDRMTKPARGDA